MNQKLFALPLLFAVVSASATTVYSEDFEGAVGAEWAGGGTVQATNGLSAFGFGRLHLKNDGTSSSVLTQSGLASHTQLTLSFNLALWDSIDLGDRFIILIDGTAVYDSIDFGNYFPADNIGHGPGTNITAAFTSFSGPDYGYNSGFRDSARQASFTVPHTANGVSISWQFPGSQGGSDESFGIDNVVLSINDVPPTGQLPIPATPALVATALLAAGLLSRRRQVR